MDFFKAITEAGKEGVFAGLFTFSFIVNLVLAGVCRTLYKDNQRQANETNKAINGATQAITITNTLLQALVGKARR